MDAHRRDFASTGKTFGSSSSSSSYAGHSAYTHGQIISYSQPRIHNNRFFNAAGPPQPSRSKSTSSWSVMADPEVKRRRRIASYKMYTAEGKVKSIFSRSMRWIKNKYIELRYGLL